MGMPTLKPISEDFVQVSLYKLKICFLIPPVLLFLSDMFQDYSTKGLTQSQLTFMHHLCQFGLVYQRKVNE